MGELLGIIGEVFGSWIKVTLQSIAVWIVMFMSIAGIGLLMAFPVMWTWNSTMPFIFGLPAITWGKAWCLNFLAGCLLGRNSTTINRGK